MITQSHALERMLRRKRQEEETAEFHSCVLLTPELKQMKKDVFITLRNPGRIDY